MCRTGDADRHRSSDVPLTKTFQSPCAAIQLLTNRSLHGCSHDTAIHFLAYRCQQEQCKFCVHARRKMHRAGRTPSGTAPTSPAFAPVAASRGGVRKRIGEHRASSCSPVARIAGHPGRPRTAPAASPDCRSGLQLRHVGQRRRCVMRRSLGTPNPTARADRLHPTASLRAAMSTMPCAGCARVAARVAGRMTNGCVGKPMRDRERCASRECGIAAPHRASALQSAPDAAGKLPRCRPGKRDVAMSPENLRGASQSTIW